MPVLIEFTNTTQDMKPRKTDEEATAVTRNLASLLFPFFTLYVFFFSKTSATNLSNS